MVFCRNVSDVRPNAQFQLKSLWFGRIIQLLSFKFRSEITDEPVTCNCAYIHLLYDYCPKPAEQRALLNHDIQILYESQPPVVYLIPAEYVLGKLPVVRVGDLGRIPHDMHGHRLMGSMNFNGTADEIGRNGKVIASGSQLYYVNKFAMIWSNEKPSEEHTDDVEEQASESSEEHL